jgi:protein-S-isoprenylcysteine O-methyltransferase Ste14
VVEVIPIVALVAIFAASVVRGQAIRQSSGDRAWAFAESHGRQRAAGLAFALAIAVSAAAGLQAALSGGRGEPLIGALLATAGAVVVIVAQVQMGRAWRVGVRAGDAPLFVRHGLFRFSRNPIFVGMAMIGLGIAVTCWTWWSWAALAVFVIACSVQVNIEEGHLESSFGEDYRSYRKQVPRWLGLGR